MGLPFQPLAVGVIVNVTVTEAPVVLVRIPPMFPLPEAAIPITATVLFLVQLKTVEGTLPDITIVAITAPEHIV